MTIFEAVGRRKFFIYLFSLEWITRFELFPVMNLKSLGFFSEGSIPKKIRSKKFGAHSNFLGNLTHPGLGGGFCCSGSIVLRSNLV